MGYTRAILLRLKIQGWGTSPVRLFHNGPASRIVIVLVATGHVDITVLPGGDLFKRPRAAPFPSRTALARFHLLPKPPPNNFALNKPERPPDLRELTTASPARPCSVISSFPQAWLLQPTPIPKSAQSRPRSGAYVSHRSGRHSLQGARSLP